MLARSSLKQVQVKKATRSQPALNKKAVNTLQPSSISLRGYATGKDITFGTDCRHQMLKGLEQLNRAVAATLGPKGRNVAIEQSWGAPKITKDGVTVAKNIDLSVPTENAGAQLVRQVANKTNDTAGDGTTTSTILTHAIYSEGCKAVAAGMNPMDLKRGIDNAVAHVIEELKKNSKAIQSTEQIRQVATISANGDSEIGDLIARAMEKVGNEGTITVGENNTLFTELDLVEGMQFDRGYISHYFATDTKSQKCIYEDPLILVYDKKISSVNSILKPVEAAARAQKPLLIIAEDVEGDALTTLVVNRLRGGLKVCAVKAPGFGDHRKNNLQDISILTGATMASEELGNTLENFDPDWFGSAKNIEVSKDNTVILDGSGQKDDVETRCDQIREAMNNPSATEYEKEKLQERLAKLTGGVAVIKVGGASEVEVNEKKDRITDSLNATRAAVEEGIVAGGGAALLHASKSLISLSDNASNMDQGVGIKIVREALKVPTYTIAKNAGIEGAVVVENLLTSEDRNHGYNAATNEYQDMFQAGVVDPLKVVRTSLVDAASVASLMTTTEVVITEQPQKDESGGGAAGGGMGGGMGGMGGMGGGMF